MQTFLSDSSYTESARVLDKVRRNKQITECKQILDALLFGGGWQNHPAVKMWRGHELSLIDYAKSCYEEFVRQGGTPDHKSWLEIEAIETTNTAQLGDYSLPWWLGNTPIHSSHRGRLLHKGNLDVLRQRIKLYIPKQAKVDAWVAWAVSYTNIKKLRDLTVSLERHLSRFLDHRGIDTFPNWYEQFGWSEEPSDDYFWPV